jgi:hypothetical protein
MDQGDLNNTILRHFKTGCISALDAVEASSESPGSNVNGKLPAGACMLSDTTAPRPFVPRARGEAGATSDEPEMKQNFSEVFCGDAHSARATAKEGLISEDCDIEDDPGADFLRSYFFDVFLDRVRAGEYVAVRFGTSYQTWPRARRNDQQGPPPLRGDGPYDLFDLEDLSDKEHTNVQHANKLVANTLGFIETCASMKVKATITKGWNS